MATFICQRFPDGTVPIRTTAGIVEFADGRAHVDDEDLAAALHDLPESFEVVEVDGQGRVVEAKPPAPEVWDPDAKPLAEATATELRGFAKDKGIDLGGARKTEEIAAAVGAWLNAQSGD